MNPFIKVFSDIPQMNGIADCIVKKETPVGLSGPGTSLCPLISYVVSSMVNKKILVISHSRTSAIFVYQGLKSLMGDDVVYLPPRELMLFDIDAYSRNDEQDRIDALYRIATGDYKAVVSSTEALTVGTTRKDFFLKSVIKVSKGMIYDMDKLCDSLVAMGYTRSALTEAKGQFSKRGNIMDVFSSNLENPCRIEFFGDEVDNIRMFDADTQRSIDSPVSVSILPYMEYILDEDDIVKLEPLVTDKEDKEKLMSRNYAGIMDRYFAATAKYSMTIEYFGHDIVTVIHNDVRCHATSDMVYREYCNTCVGLLEKKKTVSLACRMQMDIYSLYDIQKPQLVLMYDKSNYNIALYREFSISMSEPATYRGDMKLLLDDMNGYRDSNMKLFICSEREKNTEFLKGFFEDNNYQVTVVRKDDDFPLLSKRVYILENGINEGFVSREARAVCIPGGKIFRKNAKQKTREIRDQDFFSDIAQGDYVVHDHHGIGKYLGVEKVEIEGIIKDYIKIAYKGEDVLYVPVSKMDLVQKYAGVGEKIPRITSLGGHDWENQKAKVRKAVKDIAKELIDLYTKRNSVKGFVFAEDDQWQTSFEDEFIYEETDDQMKCIDEIKKDMQSTKVMDRLLCGDVGYGKTEVALRAAFKAVMNGKQVAFLAPTTMLALQHYNNFVQRVKNYPVKVDLLCRLRTAEGQKQTIKGIRMGDVDIAVGTHKLLQKDIEFKDLGLLVVDEEQRFGVAQKERIKELKPTVDVLSLSATPIPRTMHMAMSGIRDISTIYDPPEKRFPVQTYVMEYDPEVIKEAILREKDRGGQIFYLYNRVMDMDNKLMMLRRLLGDDIRIACAHGQMGERLFEDTIIKFINNEFDVLLCTTIIEAGIDIQNANTLIIEDADKLGLAQIYQIRGRVGRSDRVAYAYITYKRGKELSEEAGKRLETIKEFTEFGSGFRIAMKDLEIRGGGDLLGAHQSGHMAGVGYDMYVRILSEEIANMRGEKVKGVAFETNVDINISAYIDKEYIADDLSRLKMYKRISLVESESEKQDIIDELIDRYSDPPAHVINIIDVAYAKNMASKIGIREISGSRKGFRIIFEPQYVDRLTGIVKALDGMKQKYTVKAGEDLKISVETQIKGAHMLNLIIKLLERALEVK